MFSAVCEDLIQLDHEVIAMVDHSLALPIPAGVTQVSIGCENQVDATLLKTADNADQILLIAPESDGILEHYAALLSPFSQIFLSPGLEFIRLTSDKWKCHQWLSKRDVPCPKTIRFESNSLPSVADSFFPCVLKPIDGAGSEGVKVIDTQKELAACNKPMLLQQFAPGTPASVSVVARPDGTTTILEPGRQIFDAEPFGIHLRTEFSLDLSLQERAIRLARLAVDALPATHGYFGMDMVLGENEASDVVVEINPRLTTSYAFYRDWSNENVASRFF